MKEILSKFKEEFFKELEMKPSWGKEQIKELYIITLNKILIESHEGTTGD